MRLIVLVLLMMVGVSPLTAASAKIESLTKQMEAKKAEFNESRKALEALDKEVDALKEQYNITVSKKGKNKLAGTLNEKEKARYAQYQQTVALKNSFNTLSYMVAKEKHETLARILAKEEVIVAQKEQSCRELGLEDCQKKAYDATKKEIETYSNDAIMKRVKESGIAIDPQKVEQGVQTNIQSYVNADHGYYYAMKSDVNAKLVLDEQEMFDVEKITWNELFEEPKEIPQIPLDNLPVPKPEEPIAPEEPAPPVYHSGVFVSVTLSTQSHEISSSGSTSAKAIGFQAGFKAKNKDRFYYEYERISDDDECTLTLHGVHADWAFDLERPVYPFYGVGYSAAALKSDHYTYDGSAYHLRVGAGYEMRDDLEVDLTIRKSRIIWTLANGNTGISSLGISRDTTSYQVTVSYLF